MKRILIFSLAYYPYVGGAEVAIKEITDRIATEDIEFHLVTLRFSRSDKPEEKIGNVLIHRIGPVGKGKIHKLLYQFAAARKGKALHRSVHFDAVWAVMAHSAGVPAALFKGSEPQVSYILTLQEGDPPKQIERTMLPLWPFFVRAFTRADTVTAISTFLGNWARGRGFRGTLEVIPNGVDLDRFEGEPISHEGTILITTSRLVCKNGIDTVIRALPLLPSVTFKILGIGPEEVVLRALAQKEGVANRVEFLGHIDHTTMPEYLHGADIFIRPSRSEGQGSSFIEAMAAGLPVIATQVGGIADFLFDAQKNPTRAPTGFAVDPDQPEQIVAAVQRILSNPDTTKQVTQNAKQLVVSRYGWDRIAGEMRQVFRQIGV